MCSGKYQPIPAHYSDSMKALVDALIKRASSKRNVTPDMYRNIKLQWFRGNVLNMGQGGGGWD